MAFLAPAHHPARSKLGRIVLATAVLVGAFAFFSAILDRVGLPSEWLLGAALAATACLYVAIGLATGTTRPSSFYLADRMLSANTAGLASAAGCLGAFGIAITGWMYASGAEAAAIALGIVGGFVLSATLLAPFLRRSGAYTIAEFLAARFGRLTRVLSIPVGFAVCFLLLVAQLQLVGSGAALFGIPRAFAVWGMLGLLLACTLPGGTRSAAATALAQLAVLLIGLIVPLVVLYFARFGTLSPGAVGEAFADISSRSQAAESLLPTAGEPAASGFSVLRFAGIAVTLALATASLPAFAAPYLAARSGTTARRSVTIGLGAMLLILLASAGWAVLMKLAVIERLVGVPVSELEQSAGGAILQLGEAGMVRICGVEASSASGIAEACARIAGHGEVLYASDMAFTPEGLLAAVPALLQLSATGTALLGAALLAVLLAGAGALLAAASNALSYDLLHRTLLPRATWSGRLALARLALIATGATAAYLSIDLRIEAVPLVAIALNLAAGVLFPAMAIGVWWKRAAGLAAVAGMGAGLLVTSAILALSLGDPFAVEAGVSVGAIVSPASQVLVWPGLAGAISGLVGALVNGLVIVGVSLSTRPPSAVQQAFAGALWRSQARPLLHPDEARFGVQGLSSRAALRSE